MQELDISYLTKEEKENLFDFAKNLSTLRFHDQCDLSLIKYKSDYVYDEDPEHPESHKAGEIRCRDGFYINVQEEITQRDFERYAFPEFHQLEEWLRFKYDICLVITPEYITDGEYYDTTIYHAKIYSPYSISNEIDKYEDHDECYGALEFRALNKVVNELVKDENNYKRF